MEMIKIKQERFCQVGEIILVDAFSQSFKHFKDDDFEVPVLEMLE